MLQNLHTLAVIITFSFHCLNTSFDLHSSWSLCVSFSRSLTQITMQRQHYKGEDIFKLTPPYIGLFYQLHIKKILNDNSQYFVLLWDPKYYLGPSKINTKFTVNILKEKKIQKIIRKVISTSKVRLTCDK